jgi:hypothetical protein
MAQELLDHNAEAVEVESGDSHRPTATEVKRRVVEAGQNQMIRSFYTYY